MKNKKILKVLFFVLISALAFVNSCNVSQAVDECFTDKVKDGFKPGVCQAGDCSEGLVSVNQSEKCINNFIRETCCVQPGSLKEEFEYAYKDSINNVNIASDNSENSPVTYSSQCDSNNSNCKNDNDQAILENQCMPLLGDLGFCGTMSNYLSFLETACNGMKPSGINCNTISSAGYYGNEASKFASYLVQKDNPSATNTQNSGSNNTQASLDTGDIDFSDITATGIPDSVGGIKPILVNIARWMLQIIGLIALISFIIAGGQYLLSAGDEKMIDTAKRNMTYSIIGVIVALSGFIIIRAIDTALRAASTSF